MPATRTPGGMEAPSVRAGAADRWICSASVAEVLVPAVRPGQTVPMGNRNVQKGQPIRQAIAAAECDLVVLPASSPDCNPLEPAGAKVKTHPWQAAARTFDDPVAATREAVDAVTPADTCGCVRHRGHPITDTQA